MQYPVLSCCSGSLLLNARNPGVIPASSFILSQHPLTPNHHQVLWILPSVSISPDTILDLTVVSSLNYSIGLRSGSDLFKMKDWSFKIENLIISLLRSLQWFPIALGQKLKLLTWPIKPAWSGPLRSSPDPSGTALFLLSWLQPQWASFSSSMESHSLPTQGLCWC